MRCTTTSVRIAKQQPFAFKYRCKNCGETIYREHNNHRNLLGPVTFLDSPLSHCFSLIDRAKKFYDYINIRKCNYHSV